MCAYLVRSLLKCAHVLSLRTHWYVVLHGAIAEPLFCEVLLSCTVIDRCVG